MGAEHGLIAIDGQAAAGKTAVGRALAHRLGCPFLDTGIMYRAITWLALQKALAVEDEPALAQLALESTMALPDQEGNSIVVNGLSLGTELRTAPVDGHVSLVARAGGVRRELVRQQRDIARQACRDFGGIVMVGRDIGTVVLPDAGLKVFMVASPEVRAQRRYDQLRAQGLAPDFQQVLANATDRDRIDSSRTNSPLAPAPGALEIDTSNLTIDQVVAHILERLQPGPGTSTP